MENKKPQASWLVAATVLITILTWGSAFAGIRIGLQSYSPESLALLRYLTASTLLIGYALFKKIPLPRRQEIPGLIFLGFMGISFYNVALNSGETQISAGTASLIIASAPIFVALLASFFYKEQMSLIRWAGIFMSVLGVAKISIHPEEGFEISTSALLVLAAAAAQAIYSVSQKSFLKRYKAIELTSYAIWAGTLFLLIFLPEMIREFRTASTNATLAVIYMGIFPGVIGYASWSYTLSKIPASQAGSFLYLVPVAANIIAWFWLGEVPQVSTYIGGALILVGVALVNIKRSARKEEYPSSSDFPPAIQKPLQNQKSGG
jgi:drug/metabolite transporter (DMT)-like permease